MVSSLVIKTARDIEELKIQGARRVALSALNALLHEIKAGGDPWEAARILARSRPTEPAMRKVLARVLRVWEDGGREEAINEGKKIVEEWESALKRLAEEGAKAFEDIKTIVTHCHSTELMHVLSHTSRDFTVVVTETRPKFQGKITARELLEMGFDVVYVVDSAAWHYLKHADAFVMGVDAVEWEGNVITKVGAAMMALAANHFNVPTYFFTTTFKFDPLTKETPEPIEFRDPEEVIDPEELPGAKIENPAFDRVPADLISKIYCEKGGIEPKKVKDFMDDALIPFLRRLWSNSDHNPVGK